MPIKLLQPGLTRHQIDALNNALIDVVRSRPQGLQVYAIPGEGAYILARELIGLACGQQLEDSLLTIETASVRFLQGYFLLNNRLTRLTATRKLATVIGRLIVARRLRAFVDRRYTIRSDEGERPLHTIVAARY